MLPAPTWTAGTQASSSKLASSSSSPWGGGARKAAPYVPCGEVDGEHSGLLFEDRQQLFLGLGVHDPLDVLLLGDDYRDAGEDVQVVVALAGDPDDELRHLPVPVLHPVGHGDDGEPGLRYPLLGVVGAVRYRYRVAHVRRDGLLALEHGVHVALVYVAVLDEGLASPPARPAPGR